MRALATALAVAVASSAAGLEPGTPPGPPASLEQRAPARAQLEVRLNGTEEGEVLVVIDGDDVWMAVADLAALGVVDFSGTRRQCADRPCVSLRSLGPQIGFTVDERSLTLHLTVGAEHLGRQKLDLARYRPAGAITDGAPSAFANYSVQHSFSGQQTSAFGEIGASSGSALAWSGFTVAADGGAARGLSSLTYDRVDILQRYTAGDMAASMGGLGSAAIVGGLSWTREFSLDPYLAQAPRPMTTAFASTPSTLEVYVDGSLVHRQTVAPGTLDLTNLPVVAGTSSVQTIVRDAYGREQTYDIRANYSPGLLAPGLSDFAYHLGFLRDMSGTASFDYGRAVALGRHRFGLTDVITAGGRAEGGVDRVMAGPTLTLGTMLGEIDLELAGSMAMGQGGAATSGAWSLTRRQLSGGLRLRAMTARFTSAALDLQADRALADATAFASWSVTRRVCLGLEAHASQYRDSGSSESATVRADFPIFSGLTLLASLTGTNGGPTPGVSGMMMLSWAVGARTTAQMSATAGSSGPTASAGVQRPLPIGPGYGYRVEESVGGPQTQGTALLQGQTQFGRYEAQVTQIGPTTSGVVTASGGIVAAGGRLFATRPVDQSYTLLRTGVPGVRGYLENQEAGTTDGHGDLLLTSLQPHYANRVSINASDIPLEYEVGKVEQLVAPPNRGGVIARFPVTPMRALTGHLVVLTLGTDTHEVPRFGEMVLHLETGSVSSPITSDGRFFFDRVVAGRYPAEVVWAHGTCHLTVDVPERPGLVDAGVLLCTRDLRFAGSEETSP